MKKIYTDHAATTKLDIEAFEAMKPFLLNEFGNASQPYSFARTAKEALKSARAIIAKCIGAEPEEIFFTSGGTESDNWVIKSSAFSDQEKRATVTSAFEHHAVIHSCRAIEHLGYPVAYMLPSKEGYITPDILENYITDNTRLVSVMFANNEIGSIQPIQGLCEVAHAHGALFHTDAVQAVGHIRINVHELGVDFLSASAHKFNGPKGIGFLYIRKGVELPPYVDGGAQENARRAGTENVAAIIGMATALINNCDKIEENGRKLCALEQTFLEKLRQDDVDFIHNGGQARIPGNVNISIRGAGGEMLLHRLDLKGITISTGSACDSVNTQVSHVIKAIGVPKEYALGTIRVSFGKDNTIDDALSIAEAIVQILKHQK